jgi:hypothetical protein
MFIINNNSIYLSPSTTAWFSDMSFGKVRLCWFCLEFMFEMEQVLPLYYAIKVYKGVAG